MQAYIPSNWVKTELDNLGYILTGKTPSTKVQDNFHGEIPFIKPGDLDAGGYIYITSDTLSKKGGSNVPLLPENSILVTCIGNIGKVGITTKHSAFNQQINALIPTKMINHKYAYYYMCTLKNWFESESSSTTISIINKGRFSKAPILLPSLAEQNEIVDRLDKLLAQVEATQARLARIPDIIKQFRQSVLAAAVSGKLTEEWRIKHANTPWLDGVLGDFINKPTYGSSAKSDQDGLVPVLRMGNLQNGKLDWTDLVYTSDEVEIKKYKLRTGDVLFNRTNSPELVGKTSIYRGERIAIYAGYLIKISCLPVLNPEFLNYHLNSPSARAYCYAVKSDGVSQSNINAKKLAEYPMSLPQPAEQTEIVRRVEQLFAYADTIEQQAKAAKAQVDKLTQAILAKAFRGELTLEWRAANPDLISGDNSAAALLARIQAERAATPPRKRATKKTTS